MSHFDERARVLGPYLDTLLEREGDAEAPTPRVPIEFSSRSYEVEIDIGGDDDTESPEASSEMNAESASESLEESTDQERVAEPTEVDTAADDVDEGTEETIPTSFTFGDHTLDLDDWERVVLFDFRSQGDEGAGWCRLVVEGLAFRARCLARSPRMTDDERHVLADELTFDTAMGIALMTEMKVGIDRLYDTGEISDAGKLMQFRNKVGESLNKVRRSLTDDQFLIANAKSSDLMRSEFVEDESAKEKRLEAERLEDKENEETKKRVLEEIERDPDPTPSTEPELPVAVAESPRRIVPLLAALFVCVAAWVVLFYSGTPYAPPPALTMNDFQQIGEVREIQARPPSLYVNIDVSSWNELSHPDREELVWRIGDVAERADYLGVHVRTTDGDSVGQWLRQDGARVFSESGSDS